ncbi:MAG TPA: PAS domain-containing protein, partial [Polyangiales bacterium]
MTSSGQTPRAWDAGESLALWLYVGGDFVDGAPDPFVISELTPHLQRVAARGGSARVALQLPNRRPSERKVEAVLRSVSTTPPHHVAVAISACAAEDAYRLTRFDLVLEATRDAVWEWVVADGSVWWNERCNEVLGYSHGTGPTFAAWTDRIHPDERNHVLAGYLATVDSMHDSWKDEYRVVREDGEVRHVLDHGRVERDASGHALRLVGVMTDITEERAAQAARAELDQQFRQMAETIADVIWMTDASTHRVIYVSPAFDHIFGRPGSEVLGDIESFLDSIHPDDRARIAARLPAQLSEDYDETYRIVRPDTKVRWVRGRAVPVRDTRGNVVRVAGLLSDVTAQRQLEEQLLQSRKMESVGRLAGGVAHDFNNLLTVILSGCEFALRQLPEASEARLDIEQARLAADRAARLTSQLLAFARKQVIAPIHLDLSELTRQMDALLRRVIGEHIELVTILASDVHPVLADRGQIEQVLVNLAVNARDAMPDGGRLTLETSNISVDQAYAEGHANVEPGEYVMIAISDTGVGIAREVQEHMFEPFYTTKPAGSGTGLGLATCYGIVRQAGGQILVYSELGRGTTFKVLLPRASGVAPTRREKRPSAPPGGHETILFVEDEATVRAIGIRILAEQGYRVIEAQGGWEALRLASQHVGQIHLLVTDVVMPHMSGTELA